MQMNPRRLGFFASLPGRNIDASGKNTFGQALAQHAGRTQVAATVVSSTESHQRLVRSQSRARLLVRFCLHGIRDHFSVLRF